jgi:carbonic anhydrase
LDRLPGERQRHDRLCELNVVEQVVNTCRTTVVREAWARGQELAVHGWIYDIGDGLLRDLDMCVASEPELSACCDTAHARAAALD